MAKSRSHLFQPRPIVVRAPAPRVPQIVVRAPRLAAVKHRVKHHARRAVGKAMEEKHTIAAVGAAAALGFAKKSGVSLPAAPFLGVAGTYGLAAWVIGKYTHSRTARHIATGLLSVAAFELASEGKIAGGNDWETGGL